MRELGGCMDRWELSITNRIIEREMRLSNALHPAKPLKERPYRFLTISRDEGTLGDEIARVLAQRLSWRLYDKEIVNEIATNNHVREEMVRQLDETSDEGPQGLISETVLGLFKTLRGAPFGSEEYHLSLLKTLDTIATRGDAILVGRGSNFALRGLGHGVHVRTTGSLEVRVQRLSKSWQVAPEAARQRILAIDANRRAFIRHHFQQSFDDLRFYDIVLNTDHLSVEKVVASVLSLFGLEVPPMVRSLSKN